MSMLDDDDARGPAHRGIYRRAAAVVAALLTAGCAAPAAHATVSDTDADPRAPDAFHVRLDTTKGATATTMTLPCSVSGPACSRSSVSPATRRWRGGGAAGPSPTISRELGRRET